MVVKRGNMMTLKKAFNIGYFVLLLSFIVVYFLLPVDQIFTAIIILTVLFGVYQFVIYKKLKEQKQQ
ncbi:hypothetical protein [Bacillus pumilus]|uniref:hypothetical protein n=1 Tax=Bacillus pumilus TaxID=1408 RepID=UPI0024906A2C|nr:hypothetical protein [Bacillus pumilus]